MSQSSPPTAGKKPLLNAAQYAVLKHVASIVLPAAAALYFALSQIWHFPHTSEVMATIAAVNTVLGGLLGYSTATYNASEAKYAGIIEVTETELKKLFSLNLTMHPDDLEQLDEARFKIESTDSSPGVTNIPPGGGVAHGASQ